MLTNSVTNHPDTYNLGVTSTVYGTIKVKKITKKIRKKTKDVHSWYHYSWAGPVSYFVEGAPQNYHTPLLSVLFGYTPMLHVSMHHMCHNENSRNSWQQQNNWLFNTLQMFCSSEQLAHSCSSVLSGIKTHFNCLRPGLTRIIIISAHLSSLLSVFTWLVRSKGWDVTLCFLSGLFCRSSWVK